MMTRGVLAKATLFLLLVLFAAPTVSVAQQNSLPGQIVTCKGPDCTVCHIGQLAQNILNTAIYLAVFLSAFLFAWAGWVYMTAMGSTTKVQKAKKAFTNVAIGLVIILIGWLVVDTTMKTLVGENTQFGPWYSICGAR